MARSKKPVRERRRRGEGGVYPVRRDGKIVRYAASISLGTTEGKRRRKVIYGESEAAVLAELTKLRADHLRGLDIDPERMTVEVYLGAWLRSVELTKSAGTLHIYRNASKHHIRALGDRILPQLKAEHVELMMSNLRDAGLKEGTRKHIRAVLVTALNQALERGYISKNVAAVVEAPRVRRAKAKAFTETQLRELFAAAAGHWLAPMIQVSARLGLRSGEVRGLLWHDLDFAEMTISITGGVVTILRDGKRVRVRESAKNEDSETTLPLPAGLVNVFEARRKQQQIDRQEAGRDWQQNALIFTDKLGRPFDGTTLANAFKSLAGKANLPPGTSFHWLRHTCASLLIKRRAQPREVMELLRHRSIRTTMDVYGHMYPENLRETVDNLDRDLGRLIGKKGS